MPEETPLPETPEGSEAGDFDDIMALSKEALGKEKAPEMLGFNALQSQRPPAQEEHAANQGFDAFGGVAQEEEEEEVAEFRVPEGTGSHASGNSGGADDSPLAGGDSGGMSMPI